MKHSLFALALFLSATSFSQYVIINPDNRVSKAEDISAASSATDLVIYVTDIDSIVSILNKYKGIMKKNTKATFEFIEEKAGASVIKVRSKKVSVVDRYAIVIETAINGTIYSRQLTDVSLTNGDNVKRLHQFIEKLTKF